MHAKAACDNRIEFYPFQTEKERVNDNAPGVTLARFLRRLVHPTLAENNFPSDRKVGHSLALLAKQSWRLTNVVGVAHCKNSPLASLLTHATILKV